MPISSQAFMKVESSIPATYAHGVYQNVHDAIKHCDVEELEAMIKRGASINEIDSEFRFTPIHWAAHAGALECLHWLLWNGADPSVLTPQGWTAIHIAAIKGNDQCIEALANAGCSLNAIDKRHNTPAHLAAIHGNSACLNIILRSGAEATLVDRTGWTPVHAAAFHGRLGALQVLVRWGATIDDVDNAGNTAAHLAAGEGHLHCLKFIISNSESIDEIICARNDNGETPKMVAHQYYKQEIVEYLEAIEMEKDHPEEPENVAFPAHVAAYTGDLKHLQMLVENGIVSIDERDDKDATPAHKAAGQGHVSVLQWLTESGANMELTTSAAETPLDIARRFGQLACVRLLGGTQDDAVDKIASIEEEMINDDRANNVESARGKHGKEARGRARKRIDDLERLLDIAKKNYRQFGGVLPEDKQREQSDRELKRIIEEQNDQLEYERIRREKLESQLEEMRREVVRLNIIIDKQSRSGFLDDDSLSMGTSDSLVQSKSKKKRSRRKKQDKMNEGYFIRRETNRRIV